MERSSPHARYALLERRQGEWSAAFQQVIYDWDAAALSVERHSRPDWINVLKTGRM